MKLKIQTTLLLVLLLTFLSVNSALASEGRIILKNGATSCEGVSVWERTSYEVTGKCFGLVYPYSEQLDTYVLWTKLDNGKIERISEIDRGLFDGTIRDRFDTLYVTAESDSSPSQVGRVVMSGDINQFLVTEDTTVTLSSPMPTSSAGFFATPSTSKINPLSIGKTVTTVVFTGILVIIGVMIALFLLIKKR